jgi:hypothetical protein
MVGGSLMKLRKLWMTVAALALACSFRPDSGWASRAYNDLVTGEVTATPISGQIEVDHKTYQIKPNSLADQVFRHFTPGQVVDLVLDAPPGNKNAMVVSITAHATQ